MRAAFLVACLTVFFAEVFAASVSAKLSPSQARVGDPLKLELQITGAGSRHISTPFPESHDMALLSVDSSQAAAGKIVCTVALYRTGEDTLPPLPVVVGSGVTAETLFTSSIPVSVLSIVPDTASAAKSNKLYHEHPLRLVDILRALKSKAWVLVLVMLAFVGYMILRRAKRRAHPADQVAPEFLLPPHEQAIRDLIALQDQRYPDRGMLKEFFSEFSEIMRRYLERRYEFPALEMTTWDIDMVLDDAVYPRELAQLLIPLLREADLVKFARYLPDFRTCSRHLDMGFELVELTRQREEIPASENKAA